MNATRKTIAFLSTSALAAGAARGAVLYTPVNITVSGHGTLSLDLNQDGTPDFKLAYYANNASKPYITNTPPALTTSYVLSASGTDALPVTAAGTLINGSYQSAEAGGCFKQNSSGTVVGSWTAAGNNEGYVGLELIDGVGTHYGWAHFIYNTNGVPVNDKDSGTLTLVDAAMESSPSVGIQAGQTAETGDFPAVAVPPSSTTGYLGGTIQLSVTAQAFPAPVYQWKAGAIGSGVYTNVSNGAGVTDGAVNTLTLHNVALPNMCDYDVVVSNASGSVMSSPPATLTLLPSSDSPATLVHRYSFQDQAGSSSFADSVGGSSWNGSLNGDAFLTGSSLQLDGSTGCYATLPSDIISGYDQMTVEFWADIGANNPAWPRVFFFGDGSGGKKNSGVDYSPYAAGGYQNLDLENTSGVDVYVNSQPGITNSTGVHITVIVDSVNDALCYYNGTNVLTTLGSAVPSLADINDIDDWIGASPYPSDPYLAGTIYEFRVYQGVLSPQAIALNDASGPANYIQLSISSPKLSASISGGNIILSWPTNSINFALQSSLSITNGTSWTTVSTTPSLVGANWQVSVPSAGPAKFFQLALQ